MVSGFVSTFSTSMMQNSNFSFCTFQLDAIINQRACVLSAVAYFDMQIRRTAFCHALRKLFTRDCDELVDSLEHKSGVLPLWQTPVLLTNGIRWGNAAHFKDKHEKYPDKTDNKRRV